MHSPVVRALPRRLRRGFDPPSVPHVFLKPVADITVAAEKCSVLAQLVVHWAWFCGFVSSNRPRFVCCFICVCVCVSNP